jgi:SulP family sulfate permease
MSALQRFRINFQVGRKLAYSWDMARRDLVAGATVAAIAIPQAMAYALIAGVDPRFGLYSAFVVTIIASLLGSSSHLINGPTNAISLLVFGALTAFDERFDSYQAMFLLGIIVGIVQILIAVFKLGDLTRYVSESVILGFMAGAGVLVAVGQVGNFVGVAKKGRGDQSALVQLWETLTKGGAFSPYAIGIGAGTIVLALLLRRLVKRYKLPQMDMLIALVAATVVAAAWHWSIPAGDGKTLVSVVGKVPAALPSFHIPEISFAWITNLVSGAIAISLLGLLEALAVAKSIATYTRQPLDYNRQCLAEGIANLGGGFFQCLPGSGSLTRSSINYQAGAITRMSGVYSGLIVAIVVLLFGPYARFIPKAALAGLLFITAARLIDWRRLCYALRASWFDAALVLATAFSAIFISVDESILIGTALSVIMFVPRASRLTVRELVVTPERVVRERQARDLASGAVRIHDFEGELFFGAAPELDRYLERIKESALNDGSTCLVLRFRRTRNPDVVAIEHLERFLRDSAKANIVVLLAGVRPDLARILDNTGVLDWLPADRIFREDDEQYSATIGAVRHAYQLLDRTRPEEDHQAAVSADLYYLV